MTRDWTKSDEYPAQPPIEMATWEIKDRPASAGDVRRLEEIEQILKAAGVCYQGWKGQYIRAYSVPTAVWSDCDATWHGW